MSTERRDVVLMLGDRRNDRRSIPNHLRVACLLAQPEHRRVLEAWPTATHGLISTVLNASQPMLLLWGDDLRLLYNDGFAAAAAECHPIGFMRPLAEVGEESWLRSSNFIQRVRSAQRGVSLEFRCQRSGSVPLSFRLTPIPGEDDEIAGVFGVGFEAADDALNKDILVSEGDRLRTVFQQAPSFLAAITVPDFIVDFVNDAFYALVGDRKLVGCCLFDALPEARDQGLLDIISDVYEHGRAIRRHEMPLRLMRDDLAQPEHRVVDLFCQPIHDRNGIVGLLLQGSDITEQTRAREELWNLQANLIHISRIGAMSAMAATLAHELNQPLTVIQSYLIGARRAAKRLDIEDDHAIFEAMEGASAATVRAGNIIRRLRAMVRRGEPVMVEEDLGDTISEAVALASFGAAERGVAIDTVLMKDVIARIDRVQIQQVITNLLHNASDATKGLSERKVRISLRIQRGAAIIEVEDNGPGIDPVLQDTIFSQLFTTKADGLGVGLSIARTIVEAHGGRLSVADSGLGGASVSFRLPLLLGV